VSQRKYFGTDGIRGQVGLSHINPELMLKLGWAIGCVIKGEERKKVLIGKDTRISGYMLESALESGLSAAGIDVRLLGPMPTPGIAYLTQTLRAHAGIVISASHNPYEDNGVKIFSASGTKLPDSVELEIEKYMDKEMKIVSSRQLGKALRVNDAAGRYIEFCKSTIPSLTRLSKLKIVVDCANGATYHIAPNVFSELGADVIGMGNHPDGFNINEGCGSTAPEKLQKLVLETHADIGIALDGDGDRVILVDAKGHIINGDQIIYMIARDRHQKGLLHGGVVGTLMSNFGLEKALSELSIPFARAQVGDRHVLEMLRGHNWRIGGEASGHVVCLDKATTGDGIVAALQILAIMVKQGKTLEQLCEDMELMPQEILNIKTSNAKALAAHKEVLDVVNSVTEELKGEGRILLRPSGTEPVLRIMVEGPELKKIKLLAQNISEQVLSVENMLYCKVP
jgi:phosphoglucosamine mutase